MGQCLIDPPSTQRAALAIIIALGIGLSACGCVLGAESGAATNADAVPAARLRGAFQEKMLERLRSDAGFDEAWGVFSAGGWSDDGQVAVLVNPDRSKGRLLSADPNRNDWTAERELTAVELKTILATVKDADRLQDVDIKAFDALTFEYVHARKDKGAARAVHRIFICNPGQKPTPDHEALIGAFMKLRERGK